MTVTPPRPTDPRDAVANPLEQGWRRLVPLAAIVLSFGVVATYFPELPARVASVKDGGGTYNKYWLWLLPLLNLGLYYLMSLTPRTPYNLFNYPVPITEENAATQHRLALELIANVRVLSCLLLAYASYTQVRSLVLGYEVGSTWLTAGMVVLIFVAIGFSTKQAYQHR